MHPLKQYLQEVEESVQDFAARVGVSRQTLYRIIAGIQAPKPMLAHRIVEATGGSVTLGMLYGEAAGSAKVIGFAQRRTETELDSERLKLAIAAVVNHLQPHESLLAGPQALAVAAEAAANTYAALAQLTTRRGPARLAQALRPVLEEIVKETGSLPASAALERGADLAAQLYFQTGATQG